MTKRDIALGFALGASRGAETHNHITVEQQPLDAADAARLFWELEQKAEASIVEATRVRGTHFECVVHSFRDELNQRMKYRAVFSLNGRKMEATYEADAGWKTFDGSIMQHANGLRDEIAKEIATQIIGPAFEAMMRTQRQ